MASPLRKVLIEIISSSSKWKEEQITHSIHSAGRPDNSQPQSPHPGLQIHIWLMLVFSRSRAQLPIHVLSSSLSLLIGKTIKPPCWNPLKRQVWKDRGLGSNRWELWQSNNLLSRVVSIKICSLTISLSPLLLKFIRSPPSQALSTGSQRPDPIQSPQRGTQSQCLGRLTLLLRGSSNPRTLQCCKHSPGGSDRDKFHVPWPSTNWGSL